MKCNAVVVIYPELSLWVYICIFLSTTVLNCLEMQCCRLNFIPNYLYESTYISCCLQLSITILNCLEMQCCRLDLFWITLMSLCMHLFVYNCLELSWNARLSSWFIPNYLYESTYISCCLQQSTTVYNCLELSWNAMLSSWFILNYLHESLYRTDVFLGRTTQGLTVFNRL